MNIMAVFSRVVAGGCAAALVSAGIVLSASGTFAMGDPPQAPPKLDCKGKDKKKAECKQKSSQLSDDELYYAGYWLARVGKFAEAQVYLRQARNQDDARILNYLGYTTRKLGNVAEGMRYYAKALEINPDYTVARAYLGEAYLELRDVGKAKEQLAEIERRCGQGCLEYTTLASEIAVHENGAHPHS
jgi:tetratricopeptide (TPR) repeat protein